MLLKHACMLVVGGGGGGDVVSAYLIAKLLRSMGYRVVVASIVWERFTRDPVPGPIPLNSLKGDVEVFSWAGVAYGGCWTVRAGVLVEPTACRLARAVGEPVGLLDAWRGEVGVRLGVLELSSLYGCDAVMVVDVGGDVVAEGCEEELWSPLADSVSLSAAANSGLEAYLVVYGPGADGELSQETVLEKLSSLYDAYVWVFGLPKTLAEEGLAVASYAGTEAGMVPLRFLVEGPGVDRIRRGSRTVRRSICSPVAFVLDAARVYLRHRLSRLVAGTVSIYEARARLNEAGVYTELDLEEDVAAVRARGVEPNARVLEELRLRGRRLLGWQPCR